MSALGIVLVVLLILLLFGGLGGGSLVPYWGYGYGFGHGGVGLIDIARRQASLAAARLANLLNQTLRPGG